jgi:hypothetical protein
MGLGLRFWREENISSILAATRTDLALKVAGAVAPPL